MEEGAMAKELLPDALWARIAPLLPPEPPKPKGGRPRVSDRAALTGILFVLKTGIPWEYLPAEMGCGSGMTSIWPSCSLAAPSSPCVSSANHVQLARTVGLDRRARPVLY